MECSKYITPELDYPLLRQRHDDPKFRYPVIKSPRKPLVLLLVDFVVLYIKDLTAIETASAPKGFHFLPAKSKIPKEGEERISMWRLQEEGKILSSIQKAQQRPYDFEPPPDCLSFLMHRLQTQLHIDLVRESDLLQEKKN